jgi:Probable zinc-ribbon domain
MRETRSERVIVGVTPKTARPSTPQLSANHAIPKVLPPRGPTTRVRITDVVFVCAAFAAPAFADVTFKMKVGGGRQESGSSGDPTDYIKGNKLRMDLSVAGEQRSVILDLDEHQLIFVEPRQRMASIVDMPAHFFYRSLRIDYGSAVAADIERQNCSICPRYWYVDTIFPCDRCGSEFVFTVAEQRLWYEEYGFWIDSFPSIVSGADEDSAT